MHWDFPFLGETETLNESAHRGAAGSFVRLPQGITHYELVGPDRGTPIVLVHGFSVPSFIWDPTFDYLCQEGLRVLRYDLFGRGFSDRPRLRYDIDLFCKQLKDLLDTLDFEAVTLCGLSMGGPISATFTHRHPDRVSKLVLIDPSGARSVGFSPMLIASTLPGVGELILSLFGNAAMLKSLASDFYEPKMIQAFQDKYRPQLQYKGFKQALLSTMRNGMLGSFIDAYRAVGQLDIPVLLLWGQNDQTVPFTHSQDILSVIPQAEFHAIPECGHIPHYEKPDRVNPLLKKFIREKV